jgi:hypothetical protein
MMSDLLSLPFMIIAQKRNPQKRLNIIRKEVVDSAKLEILMSFEVPAKERTRTGNGDI